MRGSRFRLRLGETFLVSEISLMTASCGLLEISCKASCREQKVLPQTPFQKTLLNLIYIFVQKTALSDDDAVFVSNDIAFLIIL